MPSTTPDRATGPLSRLDDIHWAPLDCNELNDPLRQALLKTSTTSPHPVAPNS